MYKFNGIDLRLNRISGDIMLFNIMNEQKMCFLLTPKIHGN